MYSKDLGHFLREMAMKCDGNRGVYEVKRDGIVG